MGIFLAYMLKVTFCSALLFALYKVVLAEEDCCNSNRFILITSIALALSLPYIQPVTARLAPISDAMGVLEECTLTSLLHITGNNSSPITKSASTLSPLLYIIIASCTISYFIGIVIKSLLLIFRITQIHRFVYNAKKIKVGNTLFRVVEEHVIPFYWLNTIVVSREMLNKENAMLLAEELLRVKHLHVVDLAWTELFIVLQWFNPVAYLIKKEIQKVHQRQIDWDVIQQGFSINFYNLISIRKAISKGYNSFKNMNCTTL